METRRRHTSIASTRFNPNKSIITVMYGNTTRISKSRVLEDIDLVGMRKKRLSLERRIQFNSILKIIEFIKQYYVIH